MALLAESLVEEWLNRDGFFTIRGIKQGVNEMDLLAVRHLADGEIAAWHVEVQVSFRPVGYIAKPREHRTARTRTQAEVESCARWWVRRKFSCKDSLRDRLWPGIKWSFHLVHGEVKDVHELEVFAGEGIILHPFYELLNTLSVRSDQGFSASAGGDLAEILNYYQSNQNRPTQD